MSRDFELLQRLEREWDQTAVPESIDPEIAPPKSTEILTIAQERTPAATLPSASLTPIVRNEISKLVVQIFLSAPSKAVAFSGVEAETASQWIAGCTADIWQRKSMAECLLSTPTSSHRPLTACIPFPMRTALPSTGRFVPHRPRNHAGNREPLDRPTGTLPNNAQASAARYRRVIAELQEQFDYLIVCAPDWRRPELDMLGAKLKGVVLVIDAATTRRAAAHAKPSPRWKWRKFGCWAQFSIIDNFRFLISVFCTCNSGPRLTDSMT